MEPEQQQRIMVYFIEEAKEHLNTIEQGLLNLQTTIQSPEPINELFRAAHSIKGGAAMLGITSVQKTAHKLEDGFKILKECPIKVDQKLESLFFMVFDILQNLLDRVQNSMPAADSEMLVASVEPVFKELTDYLHQLVGETTGQPALARKREALEQAFQIDVAAQLRESLELFKHSNVAESRHQLQAICSQMGKLGEKFNLPKWQQLLQLATSAIANPQNSLASIASLVIKEIKQGQELVLAGKENEIAPSQQLRALMFSSANVTDDTEQQTGIPGDEGQRLEVGMAEWSSLANLFAGEASPIDETWQESELIFDLEPAGYSERESSLVSEDTMATEDLDLTSLFAEMNAAPPVEEQSTQPPTTEEDIWDFSLPEPAQSEQTLLEESWEVQLPAAEEFDELGALLESAPEDDLGTLLEPTGDSEWNDLESMLAESATISSANTSEFDELATLLEEGTGVESESLPIASEPALTGKANQSAPVDEEFADLENLLQQADKKLGGVPTTAPATGSTRPGRNLRTRTFDQTMRVPVRQLDNLNNLVGELVVNRNTLEQEQERMRQFLDNLLHQVQQLGYLGARMQDLYERSLLESSLNASRYSVRNSSPTTNPNAPDYDPLEMDRFSKFHLIAQEMIERIVRVRESSSDIEYLVDENDQVARRLRQVTTQLQEGLTRSRMVPFAQAVSRLQRGVRDNAMKYGKQVQLQIEGRDTPIDKVLLEQLTDPLTHMVNNAIAHGIETSDIRRQNGKSAGGKITLNAYHQGNQTIITVSDDGAGIDPEKVKAKAIRTGLITPEQAQSMSKLDVYDLLFQPGFSTKDKADELAGRGVGLDVVLTSLIDVRGTVNTDSAVGKGTTFTIRLPLTLSICKALCCVSEKASIAFPIDGIEDTLDISPSLVQTNSDGITCVPWRDSLLPFKPLSELLKHNRQISRASLYGSNKEDDSIAIIVVRSGDACLGLQVDGIIGEQEIVIKQLSGPVPKPIGVSGATVLGDGRVMPIADVLELFDLFRGVIRKEPSTIWSSAQIPGEDRTEKHEPLVLIVDDSITVRELLSMTFNKAGYRVEQARDGQEAWDKLRSGLPCDIIFCDIEMPRMDGLELLSRIQKDESLKHLPMAMLTSRGADRHRQMAADLGAKGYFTKPYLEEALLEAASRMMQGEALLAK
ncbi:MAG: response regulator [Cyanosarcina radialis HA8281-LM2]|jgi:chemosensory pili system protein ChpA (sensor histidine kinase/response regulator)|nr:response regulator [Cyanosarcina radialis HA8281-LM2]